MNDVKTGRRPPKLWLVQKLHRLTHGEVSLFDWDVDEEGET